MPVLPRLLGPDAVGFQCGLDPPDAATVDGKIDDGRPLSGRAVITNDSYIYSGMYDYCHVGATDAQYRSEANMQSWGGSVVGRFCALSITAAF